MLYEAEQAQRLLEINRLGNVSIKHGQTAETALAEMSARADKARIFTDKVINLQKQNPLIGNKALDAVNALKNNPNAARATAVAAGTGTGAAVGTATAGGTGTTILTGVSTVGAGTIAATVGASATIGLGYACYFYLRDYNEAVRIKNDTCEAINRCDNINRNMIAIGSRQRCEAQLARQQLNDAQINIRTYGNWYNGCIKYIPGTTNVSTDISC